MNYNFQNCEQTRSLAAGTSSSVKLSRFFDKVIERRYYTTGEGINPDQRRLPVYTPQYNTKLYHND